MRIVVERAFAISSNATVCTHIGLPPSRIAIATSSPSRSRRLGQHDDVGALVEREVGDRRGVGHLAEGVPARAR